MAVRDDQYAKANPMSSVTEKRPFERGKYRFPEVFGLGKDRAVDSTSILCRIWKPARRSGTTFKEQPTRPTEHESHEE